MPKKHERLTADVALALTDGRVQLYSKRGRQLLPLNQDAQLMHRQLLQKIRKGAIGPEDISVITLDLSPSNSTRNLAKVFQKASKEELGDVFKRLVSTQVLENHQAWLTTLGVALLSAVPSFTQDVLPFLPIIQISGAAKVPETLSLLLAMVNESPCWKSKGWMLSLPWVQTAKYAPFDSRPSLDLADYAGGTIKINGKKRTFSVPYASGCVAFEANIPAAVRQQIIAESPRMIPLFCGFTCKIENREIMRLDGKDFLNYDPAALSGLQQKSNLIAVIVRLFLNWFGRKKKRQEAYKQEIATFLPVVRNGRFQQVAKNTQSETMATALTVWKAFLCFAIKKQWIVEEEARDILAEFWSVLLPESAPQVKSSDTNNIWGGSAEPSTFYHYLHDFIHTYQAQIAKADQPHNASTMGILRELDGIGFLIIPRNQLFNGYGRWLREKGIRCELVEQAGPAWETKLQRELITAGINLKTERDDVTWRYSFYDKGCAPARQREKLACIGLPWSALLSTTQSFLCEVFGEPFGQEPRSECIETNPNAQEEGTLL